MAYFRYSLWHLYQAISEPGGTIAIGIHVSQYKRYEAGHSQPTLEEKKVIMELIDGMLLKHDAKRWTAA